MVFREGEVPHFASPHNDPLVVEMKVASAIVRRILIDTGSSIDIIIWDCLKKLKYPGREIIPLVHPILGFGGQEKGRQKDVKQNPMGLRRQGLHHDYCPQPTWLRQLRGQVSRLRHPEAWILALGLGLAAIFYVLNVRFKIALYAKGIRHQGQQELLKGPDALLIAPMIALPRPLLWSEPSLVGTPSPSSQPSGPPSLSSAFAGGACT
ncbi:hypothetical protein Cgig2_001559 [Carnegiea gigantea]|uniref:Uncharacterized protein n=1 Tax=Carnegiea gigantea TaxID=171969 RepID=A0A9Q1QAQ1_9CARY|nr:hypothetical protein Cgig2_001559 [Carnegiea gigantea]